MAGPIKNTVIAIAKVPINIRGIKSALNGFILSWTIIYG